MEAKAHSVTPVRLDILDSKGGVLHTSEYLKEKIVIGRILSADLRIDDPRVSRIHALIEVRADSLVITDLASSHGTFLGGKKIVESKIKFGDVFKVGYIEIKVSKGTGKVSTSGLVFEGSPVEEGEKTLINIDRKKMEDLDRRLNDRRLENVFPGETRLDDRRSGDRRIEQRKGERRVKKTDVSKLPDGERRSGTDRRATDDSSRRVGERRRGDRRVFDITSLERRIDDRRTRQRDDDVLPEELEMAFEAPDHARELELTVLWGDHILDVSNYADPIVLTVGESPRNEYIIPSEGIPDEFPLVTIEEDGTAHLSFTEGMRGTVRARDAVYPLEKLREEKFIKRNGEYYSVALKQDDFAKLSIGTINFFMLYVKPAPRIMPPPWFERDVFLMRTMIGSIIFALLFFVMLYFIPQPVPVTIEQIPERFQKIVIKNRPKIPDAIIAKNEKPVEGGSVKGEGGAAKGDEGKAGKETKTPEKKETPQAMTPKVPKVTPAPQVAKPVAKPPPRERKVVDEDRAKKVGLLKTFADSKALKDLVANSQANQTAGMDDFGKAVTGARGKTIEDVGGAGGQGLKGVDLGAGGKTIGIDGPSTKGLGRGGEGSGAGEGISGPGRLGIKGEHAVNFSSENVQVLSGLSKDIINAVVQRHRSEIRACYDAALQRNPNIRGKVVMAFSIQPNGIVSATSVKESSVGDRGLDGCISSRIRTWVFPKPEAPVVTEVTAFPFYLSPAN